MASIDDDPFAAIAGDVEEHSKRLDEMDAALRRLRDTDRAMSETLRDFMNSAAEAGGTERSRQQEAGQRWWWPAMDKQEARESWEKLTRWVEEDLIGRYPKAARLLEKSTCWYRHTDALDALTALYVAWEGAYAPDAGTTAREDWQDNRFPRTITTLNEILGSCRPSCFLVVEMGVEDLGLGKFIEADLSSRKDRAEDDGSQA